MLRIVANVKVRDWNTDLEFESAMELVGSGQEVGYGSDLFPT